MSSFTDYLIEIGYKPYRKVYANKKFEYIPSTYDYFTTVMGGGLDIRFMMGDKEIVFGLSENGKPPTLISPRPNGIKDDDSMNRALKTFTPMEIYEMIK